MIQLRGTWRSHAFISLVVATALVGQAIGPAVAIDRPTTVLEPGSNTAVKRATRDVVQARPHAKARLERGETARIALRQESFVARFDGRDVTSDLQLTVEQLPEAAVASAESETGLRSVGGSVSLAAATTRGADVSQFPHHVEIESATKDRPAHVKRLDPAIVLVTSVNADATRNLEPSSISVYTREGPGDPWRQLPSIYDAKTGTVTAHVDHLSDFTTMGEDAAAAAPRPRVVLDPDDDIGHAEWGSQYGGGTKREVTYNVRLANMVAPLLTQNCNADVLVTRTDETVRFVDRDLRRDMATTFNPDLFYTLAFNALDGTPWGVERDGGIRAWARTGRPDDDALAQEFFSRIREYTTRPATLGIERSSPNHPYPYVEFRGLPNPIAHIETLFLDHNWDAPWIYTKFDAIVNAAYAAIGTQLEARGFECADSPNGSPWPAPPSAAEKARLRNLGHQNFLRFGADPISFSTGNLFAEEELFELTGVGDQVTDLTLSYNSQDGRSTRLGVGWLFPYGASTQRYSDGSASVTLGDGRTFHYEASASGFTTPPGAHADLTAPEPGVLVLTSSREEVWRFAEDATGYGRLASWTDRQGNAIAASYSDPPSAGAFAPLETLTDAAGQVVRFEHDGEGRITAAIHPDGRRWALAYDAAGDLITITDPRLLTRRFTYDAAHRMLTATGPDGVTYLNNTYDGDGRVVKQVDARGGERRAAYDDVARITTYTNARGEITRYHFDSLGRVTRVDDDLGVIETTVYDGDYNTTTTTDANGRVWTKTFDGDGNPLTVTDPDGHQVRMTYTPASDLASLTDEGGAGGALRTVVNEVNAQGRVTTTHRPDGSTTASSFNSSGDATSLTDANGHTTLLTRDVRGNVLTATDPKGNVTSFSYDLANNVTGITDPRGNTTTFAYDTADNLVRKVDALGGVTTYEYDANDLLAKETDPRGAITRYEYDSSLNLVRTIAADGGVTTSKYDAEDKLVGITDELNNSSTLVLDQRNRMTRMTDALGQSSTNTYDGAGNLLTATDPRGKTTTYGYDDLDRRVSVLDPESGLTLSIYDAVGRLTEMVDPNGGHIKRTYNLVDQITSETDQEGHQSTSAYDPHGNLVGRTDRRGNNWTFEYDANNRRIKQTDPLGGVRSMAYDPAGNLTAETDENSSITSYTYDALNRQVTSTNPLGHTTTNVYDAVGNLTEVIDANGHHTRAVFDLLSRQTEQTDGNGHTTRFSYDLAGRKIKQVAADGVVTSYLHDPISQMTAVVENFVSGAPGDHQTNVTTRYEYDGAGNMIAMTDPNGHVTRFTFDGANRRLSETNPVGATWRYRFDPAGNVTERRDANNAVTAYAYTPDHQTEAVHYPDGSGISFVYDPENQPTRMTDSLGTAAWTYDALSRPTTTADSLGRTIQARFDAVGNRTRLTLPNGYSISCLYDAARQMTGVASPWGSATFTYDAVGNQTGIRRDGNIQTTNTYDAANQLLTMATSGVTGHGGGTADSSPPPDVPALVRYRYDSVGDVTQRVQSLARTTLTSDYTYDPLRRLAHSMTNSVATDYRYDAAGNRRSWTTGDDPTTPKPNDRLAVTETFTDANQVARLTALRGTGKSAKTTVTDLTYDLNGNRTLAKETAPNSRVTATTYAYDFENRLATVGRHNRSIAYQYDGQGRRLVEADGTGGSLKTTEVLFDGLEPIASEDTGNGHETVQVRGTADELLLQQNNANGQTDWYLNDGLDSVIGLVSEKGHLNDTATYTDFGLPNLSGGYSSKFAFTGEAWDSTFGLSSFFARTYDPLAATWLQADPYRGPLTQPQSLQRYAYVGNNPCSYPDTYGFQRARRAELAGYPAAFAGKLGPDSSCGSLSRGIEKIRNELAKRADEIARNPRNLPFGPGRFTVFGHQIQFVAKQVYMRGLLGIWDLKGCGNGPGPQPLPADAWKWATRSLPMPERVVIPEPRREPAPQPSRPNNTGKVAAGAGIGGFVLAGLYIAYRVGKCGAGGAIAVGSGGAGTPIGVAVCVSP